MDYSFCGRDQETVVDCYVDSFAVSSTNKAWIAVWKDVGTVAPINACMDDKQVW